MEYTIRLATPEDKAAIAPFTTDTFDWGDYVQERYDDWLADERSHNLVTTFEGAPIAFARSRMLSPTELWLQGGRVHPDHKGKQIIEGLTKAMETWGVSQGARISRNLIEDWNSPAQRSVEKQGYRKVSQWCFATREIKNRDPQPTGNGGKRVRGDERIRPASSAEAEPAYMAWSTSDLMRSGRSLFAADWAWRRLTLEDLNVSARNDALYESASGWAIITRTSEQFLNVSWMMTNPDDTFRLIRAILDWAIETDAKGLEFFAPATDEMTSAFDRIGCTTKPMSIWERSI